MKRVGQSAVTTTFSSIDGNWIDRSRKRDWATFRRLLAKNEKKLFDDLFDGATLYGDASKMMVMRSMVMQADNNSGGKTKSIMMAMLLHHYKQLIRIQNQVDHLDKICTRCEKDIAEIFQNEGDFCLQCWQDVTHTTV